MDEIVDEIDQENKEEEHDPDPLEDDHEEHSSDVVITCLCSRGGQSIKHLLILGHNTDSISYMHLMQEAIPHKKGFKHAHEQQDQCVLSQKGLLKDFQIHVIEVRRDQKPQRHQA